MNILVSILYYLLFTNFYSILHLYHNTSLFITIPANLTRISATPPTKVGTDRKPVRRRSSPCHPCPKRNRVDLNHEPDPNFLSVFGHSIGQGWYWSEARATPVISIPPLSPESVWKAVDRSCEEPQNCRFNSPWFRQFLVTPPLGFCSPQFPLSFPTNNNHWGSRFAVDRHFKDLRLWEKLT